MSKDFKIGDYVAGYYDSLDVTGTVVVLDGSFLGVQCDSDMHDAKGRWVGHNLDGRLPDRTGWWISKASARLIPGGSEVSDDAIEDLFDMEV